MTSPWPWPSFTPDEIRCKGTGKLYILPEAMDALQLARDIVGLPFHINSAYRSPEHNKAVGGAKNSYHVRGMAFDISLRNHDRSLLLAALKSAGFKGIGHYDTFIHADIRPGAPVVFDRRH